MTNPRTKFSKIYDTHIDKIYRFIFFKVTSEEIAQDLSSETFLKGWQAYKSNPQIKNPSAFLYKIAQNLVIDYYRQKEKNQFISPEDVPIIDPSPGLEEKIALTAEVEEIKVVLADMKEDYQNVIIWRYLEGLPLSQMAKMLDKSKGATRVTLHRALKSLREKCNKRRTFTS